MRDPVRLGIVGLGRMGSAHAEALAAVPEIEVVALADPRIAARQAAGLWHPGAVQFGAAADLLEGGIGEAVLVASPTSHHPGFVEAALDAGLHVLCEKPLALDPAVSDALGDRAAKKGLVLQVGFWRRFAPPWASAAAAIAAGRIGRPILVRLSQWDADPPPPEFCDPAVSGGLAVDCGVHEFDLAEWLTGERIISVRAESLPLVDDRIGDVGDVDNLLVVGALEGGGKIIVDLSRNARYGDDVRTEVLGSDGAILIDLLPEGRARIGTKHGMVELEGSQAGDAMAVGLQRQAGAFADAVRGQRSGIPDAVASSRAVRAAHAAMRSLERGSEEPC